MNRTMRGVNRLFASAPIKTAVLSLAGALAFSVNTYAADTRSFEVRFQTALDYAQKTQQGAAYEKEFLSRLRPVANQIEKKCITNTGDKNPKAVKAIVTQTADGAVESITVAPLTPYARCLQTELSDIKWPRPPFNGYQNAIDFD